MEAPTETHIIFQDIGHLFQGEFFTFLMIRCVLPMVKELLCVEMAFQIAAETVSSSDSSSDLHCPFMNPNTHYQMHLNGIFAYICQLHTTHN
jgi:hypothetical protein